MKSTNSFLNSKMVFSFKRILYAIQVLIITLSLPALSYMELSQAEKKVSKGTEQNSIKSVDLKSDAVAFNAK